MLKLDYLYRAILFCTTYFSAIALGTLFIQNNIAYFWPASGIACAFFVFSHKRFWLTYTLLFIPSYLLPIYLAGTYLTVFALFACAANLLQSLAAGYFVQRFIS